MKTYADESFARYGLDSVQATALMARLAEHVGKPVSPVVVWRYPSIRALARHLAGAGEVSGPVTTTAAPAHHDEPIAIVGMACRFPGGADDPARWPSGSRRRPRTTRGAR